MENMHIDPTERSPEIRFDFAKNQFLIKGESYPENVNSFFGPVMEKLTQHCEACEDSEIQFQFELIYFNSSTAKILMGIFDLLDETAEAGNKVNIEWIYEEDDDNMEELGEEYGEDLVHAHFALKPVAPE